MRAVVTLLVVSTLAASGCAPRVPELEARVSNEPRGTAYPELVPLGSLLAEVDTAPEREAAPEGQTLDDRAEELRRRAARLRARAL